MKRSILFLATLVSLYSCSPTQQISRSAKKGILQSEPLQTAHIGISIFDPATNKYLYNYQSDKYFVPASNTKIPTCYAVMKYLGDSLVGLRYGIPEEKGWNETTVVIDPTGDPTFLHPDYKQQFVFDTLFNLSKKRKNWGLLHRDSKVERWGSGWSWNDYDEAYMAERNTFPIFGNVISLKLNDLSKRVYVDNFLTPGKKLVGKIFNVNNKYLDSLINTPYKRTSVANVSSVLPKLKVERSIAKNEFFIGNSDREFMAHDIPFVTNGPYTTINILEDSLKRRFAALVEASGNNKYDWLSDDGDISSFHIKRWNTIHSQPTDSLLKPMMHRSDNFFAEQSLLMASNEYLGVMSDNKIIDTLLKTHFKDLPQKPRWVDGSGLSRYNLFTPQDFVAILNKMKNEFGMERIQAIFPTGNEGTLTNYYKDLNGKLFAKTGTLSGVVALSGYMYTKKGKLLLFSVLVNNHQTSSTNVRRAVEHFITGVQAKY